MSAPHDRPTVVELVEAVREYLESDVLDRTEGRVRFHARVAINVLGMVEREIQLGPDMAMRQQHRLNELGYADERELAVAIRRGDLDQRYREVKAAIRESVEDKLRVANPDYLD
ncbi:MAG: hypothetical protein JJLCMIEE_00055 [Acidimicrobiales bacterium]|nr:hypothetical protein [Acidimicrobiales bacterium]